MAATVAMHVGAFHRRPGPSPVVRLAQLWGKKDRTVRDELPGLYRRVAESNTVHLDLGQPGRVIELMTPIEISLNRRVRVPLPLALFEARMAALEFDRAYEEFQRKQADGTASVEDARDLQRRSANVRNKQEVLENELEEFIRDREGR